LIDNFYSVCLVLSARSFVLAGIDVRRQLSTQITFKNHPYAITGHTRI